MKENKEKLKLAKLGAEITDFLPLILETTFDAVLISHEDGRLLYVSPNVPNMFGIDPEKIDQVGNISSLFGEVFFSQEKLKKVGRIDQLECRIPLSGREDRTLLVNLRWAACRGGMILICCRDITDIKKAEQVLRDDERMKHEFTSAAGHALRTPLTVIKGYAELLLLQPAIDVESRQRSLANIVENAQELAKITYDLLDLSQNQDKQGLNLLKSAVYAKDLIERVISNVGHKIPPHRLEIRLPEAPVCLLVDQSRMERVLENLLDNAVKFSLPNGLITLCGQPQGEEFLFQIGDEGIGMTPEQQDKVFDKFYRADGTNSAIPGLGLGMSIARRIVEEHGGCIWLESRTGIGTTVNFTVPMVAAVPMAGRHLPNS